LRTISTSRNVGPIVAGSLAFPLQDTPAPVGLGDSTCASDLVPVVARGTATVIGNFDGVHRGHQALFERAVALARERELVPVALTFDPHPSVALGRTPPPALTTLARRVELISRAGISHVFVRRFDAAFAAWAPERFIEELVARDLFARVVVCGKNFRFGKDRAGDPEILRVMGDRLGFEALTAEARDASGALSSTRARDAVARGDLGEAEAILGRRHAIEGEVVRGDARGRTLGFPTANVAPAVLLPPNGVYAVVVDRVARDTQRAEALAPGVMNLGVRPTVAQGARPSVEVHLFDFDEDLYGETLRVHVVAKLREERRFPGLDALKAQIEIDAREARAATRDISRGGAAFG
jgi:riboflavin kinase/FMN adenylyltransferase